MERRDFIKFGAASSLALAMPYCVRAQTERTTLFRGGTVLPVDDAFSEHTALLIRGSRVVGVGSDEEMLAAAGEDVEIVDLDGRTVLPGFIEPHMHFALLAAFGHTEDVGPFKQPTFGACLAALRKVAGKTSAHEWIVARQFDPVLLEPPRELTTRELDEISNDRPIFVLNASGHIAYVNSKALELANITKDTPDPKGAQYGRY